VAIAETGYGTKNKRQSEKKNKCIKTKEGGRERGEA
jgi:hypothetical protein